MSKSPVICQEKWEQKNEVRVEGGRYEREKKLKVTVWRGSGGNAKTRRKDERCAEVLSGYFHDSLMNFD